MAVSPESQTWRSKGLSPLWVYLSSPGRVEKWRREGKSEFSWKVQTLWGDKKPRTQRVRGQLVALKKPEGGGVVCIAHACVVCLVIFEQRRGVMMARGPGRSTSLGCQEEERTGRVWGAVLLKERRPPCGWAGWGVAPPSGQGKKGTSWGHGTWDLSLFALTAAGGQCQLLRGERWWDPMVLEPEGPLESLLLFSIHPEAFLTASLAGALQPPSEWWWRADPLLLPAPPAPAMR